MNIVANLRFRTNKLFVSAVLCTTMIAPLAADDRQGIAFVQAPEESSGICTGKTMEDAFACAVKKCTDGGALAQDCIKTNWCQPAGWSVDVFLQHNEGIHWHEISCGWATQKAALAAAKIMCDPTERQYVVDCIVAAVYDPTGKAAEWKD